MGRHFWADSVTKMVSERFEKMKPKKYKIIGKIVLGFILEREQQDVLLSPVEGNHLELIGGTVWYVTKDGERHESITTANVIDVALERGDIEEIWNSQKK